MLAAVTCYFNPSGYRSKIENYRIFRRHLAVPLTCVELSFTGTFELTPTDADTLIQIHGRAILWQKERLMNLGLRAAPAAAKAIGWIDCDVIFEDPHWAERALDALRRYPLIQLFERRCNLAPTAQGDDPDLSRIESEAVSLGYKLAHSLATPDDVRRSDAPLALASTAGLAWAARREVLTEHGLYDACILGTADRVMAAAALGVPQYGRAAVFMNEWQWSHYRAWAARFSAAVRGAVGYVPGRAFHLWHGDLRHRRYRERHEGLRPYNFDPSADIAHEAGGCWRWNTDKPAMHTYVRDYFAQRDEDGVRLSSP
jgi:hypothetical protein